MSLLFAWEKITSEFADEYGVDTTEFLLSRSSLFDVQGNQAFVTVDELVYPLFNDKTSVIYSRLQTIMSNYFSCSINIHFSTDSTAWTDVPAMELPKEEIKVTSSPLYKKDEKTSYTNTNLDPEKHFANYFYSYDNKNIVDVCSSIIENIKNNKPNSFNPLFIHGNSGIGKTHIVNALGNELYDLNNNLNILINNSTDFTTAYSNIFKNGLDTTKLDKFKEQYATLDVFIIDDIQMLQTKEATLDEFFLIFEKLVTSKKLVIITCDVNPNDLKIKDRLLSRFLSGLVLEMKYPDSDTKTQIFQHYAEDMDVEFEERAIQVFIQNSTNVRELEGYTNAIRADLITNDGIGSLYTEADAVERIKKSSGQFNTISKRDLLKLVAEYYKIEVDDIKSRRRALHIVRARNFCIIFMIEHFGMTQQDIGLELGLNGHSNVSKVYKRADEIKERNQSEYRDLEQIINKIK